MNSITSRHTEQTGKNSYEVTKGTRVGAEFSYKLRGTKRFRKAAKWQVQNRILYGLMFAEDLPTTALAQAAGVSGRTVNTWVYEGRVPRPDMRDKLEKIFRLPWNVLFMEVLHHQ